MTLPIYVPALRLKQGEYRGLNRLARDVADKILPRLIIPPPKERDPEKGRPLTPDEIVYETGRRIAEHWPLRDALLDVQFLYNEFGETESRRWLPRIFEVARSSGAKKLSSSEASTSESSSNHRFSRAIAPTAATLQHMNNTADDATIICSLDAANIRRQLRFDPAPLLVAQPK